MVSILILLALCGYSSAFSFRVGNLFTVEIGEQNAIREMLEGLSNDCPQAQDDGCPPELQYWFYNKDNKDGKQIDVANLGDVGFTDNALKVMIHGYQNTRESEVMVALKNGYLDTGDYNLIIIDWSHFNKEGCYLNGVYSINPLAACAAGVVKQVWDLKSYGHLHVLGFSLGAHFGGRMTSKLKDDHDLQTNRLTRFEPAFPMFFDKDNNVGVADFRDTYHSDINILGQGSASANIDVYLNNGQFQPGCGCDIACSHSKSVYYFAESIKTDMWGIYCSSWQKMVDGDCNDHAEGDVKLIGDKVDIGSFDTNVPVSLMTFGRGEAPYLFSKDDYINNDTFNSFDDIGKAECSITDNIKDKVVDYLKGNK